LRGQLENALVECLNLEVRNECGEAYALLSEFCVRQFVAVPELVERSISFDG
jgi:hypothetical protein